MISSIHVGRRQLLVKLYPDLDRDLRTYLQNRVYIYIFLLVQKYVNTKKKKKKNEA